jgi:hypothetical protein
VQHIRSILISVCQPHTDSYRLGVHTAAKLQESCLNASILLDRALTDRGPRKRKDKPQKCYNFLSVIRRVFMALKVLVGLFVASIWMLFGADQGADQGDTVKLNGGLEATILQVGRSKDHKYVTVSLRIANKGTSTAYLLLVDRPLATDNTGAAFDQKQNVSGIADCNNYPASGWPNAGCLGIPQKNNTTVPLQSFTTIEPNTGPISVSFRLSSFGPGDGPLISFSANIYLRLVSDPLKDDTLSDAQKYGQFRLMTLSFPPRRVTEAQ